MTKAGKIRVCVAGATGWAGSELSKAIIAAGEFELVSGISRKESGKKMSEVLNMTSATHIPVFGTIEEALQVPFDLLVEYTNPVSAMHNVTTAVANGINVLIGTSGLTEEDYDKIEAEAKKHKVSVLAVGNFAISVVLLNKFAEVAAKYMSNWEIIDYASSTKVDSPSGSARELAYRLSKVRKQKLAVAIEDTQGPEGIRGANLNDTQVHAVRLPGFVISLDAIFGNEDEKLTIKHEAGNSAKPYVAGAFIAIRNIGSFVGLKRGLDSVMDFPA